MSMQTAQRWLCTVWGVFALLWFAVLIGQTIGGVYGSQSQVVWKWFLPLLLPTLTLIFGVIVTDFATHNSARRQIDRYVFWLAIVFSVFYLVVVALPILTVPWHSPDETVALMEQFMFVITGLHSLTSIVLGVFFGRGKEQ